MKTLDIRIAWIVAGFTLIGLGFACMPFPKLEALEFVLIFAGAVVALCGVFGKDPMLRFGKKKSGKVYISKIPKEDQPTRAQIEQAIRDKYYSENLAEQPPSSGLSRRDAETLLMIAEAGKPNPLPLEMFSSASQIHEYEEKKKREREAILTRLPRSPQLPSTGPLVNAMKKASKGVFKFPVSVPPVYYFPDEMDDKTKAICPICLKADPPKIQYLDYESGEKGATHFVSTGQPFSPKVSNDRFACVKCFTRFETN